MMSYVWVENAKHEILHKLNSKTRENDRKYFLGSKIFIQKMFALKIDMSMIMMTTGRVSFPKRTEAG